MPTTRTRQELIDSLSQCGNLSYREFVNFLHSIPFLPFDINVGDIPNIKTTDQPTNLNTYNASEVGIYSYFGNITVTEEELSSGLVQIRRVGDSWVKFILPIDVSQKADKATTVEFVSLYRLRTDSIETTTNYQIQDKGIEGLYVLDETDTTSTDNTGTIIVNEGGSRFKRVYSGDLNIRWFGAKGDGFTDDTNAFELAINTAKALGGIRIYIPAGVYKINRTIDLPRESPLMGAISTTILDFSDANISVDKGAINFVETITNYGNNIVVLSNLLIKGMPDIKVDFPNASYKDCCGLEFNTHEITIENVFVNGFNRSTIFKNNAYIIFFNRVFFRGNNYGFHFHKPGFNNLGENINLTNCTMANNNFGFYNNGGEIISKGCSIDYNKVQIQDNRNDDSGFSNSKTTFLMCHFEGNDFKITNNGILYISECEIWCDHFLPTSDENINSIIYNNGQLSLCNNHFRVPGGRYLVEGVAPIAYFGNTGNFDTENIYMHKFLSKIYNSNFELDDLTGFVTDFGTPSISTDRFNSGTKSLKVFGDIYANGQVSFTIPIKGSAVFYNCSAFIHLNGSETTPFIIIRAYNKSDVQVGADFVFSASEGMNARGFNYAKSDWVYLRPGIDYIKVSVKLDIGTDKSMYLDDVYVNFK